ncbi:MAG: LexA family transcriptional regulator [bacterium]|nr:LexA family transcriptional regulator [bacterium]
MRQDFLNSLKSFYSKYRRLPSYSEMLKLFGFASKKAVFDVIQRLTEEGFLNKNNRKLSPTSSFFAIPLYGVVKAGYPILTEENKQYLTLDEYLIEDPVSSFLLKVSGDSLFDIGIFDGDIVIIERKKEAKPGDIVLAEIDNEWTLKILRRDRKRQVLYLEAANDKYPPFYPKRELKIYGVVKASVRKFERMN